MLVVVQARGGRRVPFQTGETAKSSMLAFRVVGGVVFVGGGELRDGGLESGVAVVGLRMQRTENMYDRQTRRDIFPLIGRTYIDQIEGLSYEPGTQRRKEAYILQILFRCWILIFMVSPLDDLSVIIPEVSVQTSDTFGSHSEIEGKA